jgi:hypothetical protein
MAGSNLSDEELREAAAEAGISPEELRIALAERHGSHLPARRGASAIASVMGPAQRGVAATHVEGRVRMPPPDALAAVRRAIERQTGRRGHKQGGDEADIVDEDAGVTYRMRAADDGAGGALVRVDVDPSSGKGGQALATTGVVGVTTVLVGLGWLFGATLLWLGGLGIGALGGAVLLRSIARLRGATAKAHAISAQALSEADERG